MSWNSNLLTSIFGRRVGLQPLSTGQVSNPALKGAEVLVGPEAVRSYYSAGETTAANLPPYGHSFLSSAVSSGVYTLDPPITGVRKTLTYGTSGATIYVKTANGETIQTTQGTSQTTLKSTQNVPCTVDLVGLSTAQWGMIGAGSSAILAASTST